MERYVDYGVSGAKTHEREDLPAADFWQTLDSVVLMRFWVWKIDRLGRDDVDPLIVWKELEGLGIKVYSSTEGNL